MREKRHEDHHHGRGGWGFGRLRGRFDKHGESPMRKSKLLTSEELHLVILQLLSDKPNYGYEIIKAIEEHSSGIYSPSPGMIYPVLTYLEEMGHAVSKLDGNKKLFELTQEGRAHLSQNREALTAILDQIKSYGEKVAYFQNQMAQEELAGERWGGHDRGREGLEMKMEFHELRHELKSALFAKKDAPIEEKQRVLAILKKAIADIRE